MTEPASVLIIDDDTGMCETVGDVLRMKGHAVYTASRGQAGLDRLRAHSIDAGIVDIKLPDISGLDLLQAMKASSPGTEVIFITGFASLATAIQAINGSAFAYLVKPFEMEHLLATLAKALEKQQLTRALRESEERYRLITEHINDAVFLCDLDGRLVLSNRRAQALTGYQAEELGGRSILALLDPAGAGWSQMPPGAGGVPQAAGLFEGQLLTAGGGRVWVEVSATSVVREGQAVGRLVVAREITERKQAQDELQRQRAALMQREKLAAMGSLLAGVAHELNNPLSVVMGQAGLLREALGDGVLRERVDKLAQGAERCARIVRNFLALARQRPPERRRVRLNQVVRETLELLAYPLRVDTVETPLDLAADLPMISADPFQLQQVVVNLVSNAHQAMREAPPPRRLTLTTRYDPAHARVSLRVADTGPGIPPQIEARIFEPFFTTKAPGEGTGLGLSLCHGIVEAHGGSVRAERASGHGAVFVVELPVDAPLTPPEARASESPAPIRGKRILVVDDEPEVAALIADILSADGHEVDTAATGGPALEKVRERDPDVILSDVRMPDMDGPALYRALEGRYPQLERRIIFITGDAFDPQTREFLERTRVLTVSKPFVPEEVRQMVQAALRAQRTDAPRS